MFEGIVKRGTLMTVTVLIVSVLGLVAAYRIPVQMIPDLEVRTVTVRTAWPGATPQDVEKEILIEQEEYLRTIPSLQQITAQASFGQARIELEFPFGVDLNETLIRVNNALTQVPEYPLNVDEPRIYATSFSSNSFMYFRVAPLPGNPRGLDMDLMKDFLEDHVRTRMESVAGVSEVRVGGGAERQVQILLDPARLAQRGLTLTDVRLAVQARNRDISGGEIESGKRRYLLRTVGRFKDLQELRDLIKRVNSPNAGVVFDVGNTIGTLEPAAARLDVAPARGEEWFELLAHKLLPQLELPPLLVVAVVGGTNIGKSLLFNQLTGQRASRGTR